MTVNIPPTVNNLGQLVTWVKTHLIRERHDMFATADTIRPGILVLINDVDWELEGTTNYQVKINDRISFISTLHGG